MMALGYCCRPGWLPQKRRLPVTTTTMMMTLMMIMNKYLVRMI